MKDRLIERLSIDIKGLVLQEIRLLRLKQTVSPEILIDEISRSIEDTKARIVRLTRFINFKQRERLLRQMLIDAIDEEIERAVKFRSKRCLRCIHVRFYDNSESSYEILPSDNDLIKMIGCDHYECPSEIKCTKFIEISSSSLENYLNDITILYEFREWVEQIDEIWQEYFLL